MLQPRAHTKMQYLGTISSRNYSYTLITCVDTPSMIKSCRIQPKFTKAILSQRFRAHRRFLGNCCLLLVNILQREWQKQLCLKYLKLNKLLEYKTSEQSYPGRGKTNCSFRFLSPPASTYLRVSKLHSCCSKKQHRDCSTFHVILPL